MPWPEEVEERGYVLWELTQLDKEEFLDELGARYPGFLSALVAYESSDCARDEMLTSISERVQKYRQIPTKRQAECFVSRYNAILNGDDDEERSRTKVLADKLLVIGLDNLKLFLPGTQDIITSMNEKMKKYGYISPRATSFLRMIVQKLPEKILAKYR